MVELFIATLLITLIIGFLMKQTSKKPTNTPSITKQKNINCPNIFLNREFTACMFAFWFLVIPPIIGVIALHFQEKSEKENDAQLQDALNFKKRFTDIGCERYDEVTQLIEDKKIEFDSLSALKEQELSSLDETITEKAETKSAISSELSELEEKLEKTNKQLQTQTNKIKRIRQLYKSVMYCIENKTLLEEEMAKEITELESSETLELHCLDVKSLRKAFRQNDKQITKLTEQYSARYTTKANQAIYKLMTIALRSELQNILYSLKYKKLDEATNKVKEMTAKYLSIAGNGNQSIAGTLTTFIGELEYFFIEAVKIEYNYYVKKEQARQEQLAIREQMRQEAAERKALADAKKKVEQEEEKYKIEIEKLEQQIKLSSEQEKDALQLRILELEKQLSDVTIKKEEISNLQNGKAGNVYIISNLGSFGENVFKIGMTRRLDPQDRINELGSASVPFKFDVHSFIFSDDAVSLENKLHQLLNDKRVNKVNLRKEFFYTSVDELEKLVSDIDSTAEFKKTMLAEEFRQSQENIIYDTSVEVDDIE